MLRSPVLALVAVVAATLALTACGGDEGGDYSANPVPVTALGALPGPAATPPPSAPPEPVAVPAPALPATPPAVPAGGVALAAREVPGLGTVVADGQGFTLYRFDQDTPRPPAATCVAECATTWPPVVVDPEGALDLEGVERSAVAFVQRRDGTSQLTIGGWPVYRYSGDSIPGSAVGQGVDATWFAVTPEGARAG